MSQLIDLHVYTNNTRGAKDKISLMCETAVTKGLRAVAFTDSVELDRFEETESRRRLRHAYFDMAKARALFFDSLSVFYGVELRQAYLKKELARQIVAAHTYDLVLTRVSRLPDGTEVRFDPEQTQADFNAMADAYTDALLETVEDTPFDVVCGLFAPLRHATLDYTHFGERIRPVLHAVADKEKAIELNTKDILGSDRLRDLGFELLRDFHAAGGRYVTVGSGCRFHDEIGVGVDQAVLALRRAGFSIQTFFDHRLPYEMEL